jgi:hypothetical protein
MPRLLIDKSYKKLDDYGTLQKYEGIGGQIYLNFDRVIIIECPWGDKDSELPNPFCRGVINTGKISTSFRIRPTSGRDLISLVNQLDHLNHKIERTCELGA